MIRKLRTKFIVMAMIAVFIPLGEVGGAFGDFGGFGEE